MGLSELFVCCTAPGKVDETKPASVPAPVKVAPKAAAATSPAAADAASAISVTKEVPDAPGTPVASAISTKAFPAESESKASVVVVEKPSELAKDVTKEAASPTPIKPADSACEMPITPPQPQQEDPAVAEAPTTPEVSPPLAAPSPTPSVIKPKKSLLAKVLSKGFSPSAPSATRPFSDTASERDAAAARSTMLNAFDTAAEPADAAKPAEADPSPAVLPVAVAAAAVAPEPQAKAVVPVSDPPAKTAVPEPTRASGLLAGPLALLDAFLGKQYPPHVVLLAVLFAPLAVWLYCCFLAASFVYSLMMKPVKAKASAVGL